MKDKMMKALAQAGINRSELLTKKQREDQKYFEQVFLGSDKNQK